MANRVRFYQLWDARNLVWGSIVVIVVSALIFFSFFYPQITDNKRLSGFDAQTKGRLIEYQPIVTLKQTKLGTEVVIDEYKVTYSYTVKGQVYKDSESIDGLLKYGNILKRLTSTDKSITILYMKTEPSNSTVDLEN